MWVVKRDKSLDLVKLSASCVKLDSVKINCVTQVSKNEKYKKSELVQLEVEVMVA